MVSVGAEQYCGVKDDQAQQQALYCPIKATPKKCRWSGGENAFFCSGACHNDEIPVVSSTEPYIDGGHQSCYSGFAQYCCKSKQTLQDVCRWTEKCADIKNKSVCRDQSFVTAAQEDCKYPNEYAYCCDRGIDTSSCYWNEGDAYCSGALSCSPGYTQIITDQHGGKDKHGSFHECQYELWTDDPYSTWEWADLAFCCNANNMGKETINLPVPLNDLFPTPRPESDVEKLNIKLDQTMGGQRSATNNVDPNVPLSAS